MSLLAIANLLKNGIVQQWFHSEPRVRATELLLQERPAGRVAGKRRDRGRSKVANSKARAQVAVQPS